jgi:hypothetical protein
MRYRMRLAMRDVQELLARLARASKRWQAERGSIDAQKRRDARSLVEREIDRLRTLSYQDLLTYLDKPVHEEILTSTEPLLLETQVFVEDRNTGLIRVVVDVAEFAPRGRLVGSLAGDGFLRAADESFLDE